MSYTTVYLVHENCVETITRLKNSWGSGAFVWSGLGERYFGDRHIWSFTDSGAQKIWDLVRSERLSLSERIVLASTFDHAIIERDKFFEASEHWATFNGLYHKPNSACHIGTISGLLREHHRKQTPCIGMCFQQTSVAESMWEKWDEENDCPVPFSLATYEHFFVFKEFGDVESTDK